MGSSSSYAIHWFRRDLRVENNPALRFALDSTKGRVLALFCIDQRFLSRSDFSINRFGFFLETLASLREQISKAGGELLVVDRPPLETFKTLLASSNPPKLLTFNRDYEPYALERDRKICKLFDVAKVATHTERDHLIIEPHELATDKGEPYRVFTPFFNRWTSILSKYPERISSQTRNHKEVKFSIGWSNVFQKNPLGENVLDLLRTSFSKKITIPMPHAGHASAMSSLRAFYPKIGTYDTHRDIPSIQGTSRLSMFFKNGSMTTAQALASLPKQNPVFTKEIAWREFYYHILFHYPEVENLEFQVATRHLDWKDDPSEFESWKQGTTGYPIVDAAMRELNQTGFMHNRSRMIVASFLTKHLRTNWRLGAQYFMEQLLDGDLAPNNGGWQWAASTGCDPQPYFRIFNPELQSKKFDPEGTYIRKYVPELRNASNREVHVGRVKGYPSPIVEHAAARTAALRMFSEAKKKMPRK